MRLALVLVAALFATGCERCEDHTTEYEAIYDDGWYDVTMDLVASAERQGYECDSRPIRNAFGVAIGTRYTCTKCI